MPQVVAAVERKMIRKALDHSEWVKARAAKILGVSERVLSYKVGKYGLAKE